MANPTWPIALPQSPPLGTRIQQREQSIVETLDLGPPKRRRRTSADLYDVVMPMALENYQLEALVSFYTNDTAGGSLQFDWVHPLTDAPATYMFATAPSFTLQSGGHKAAWTGTLQLILVP